MFCGLTWISSDEPHLFFNLVKPEFLDANNSNLTQKCSYPVYQRSDCRIRFRTDIHFWFKVLQYYSFLCSLLSSAGHSGLPADYLNLLLNWCFFVLWSRPKTALIALKQMALKGLTTNLMFPWTCWEGGGGGNWEKQTPFFSVFDCFKTFSLPVFSVFPVFFSFFHVFFPVFPQFFPTFFSFFLTGLSPYFLTVFLPAFSLSFPISSPVFSCSFSLCFFASFFWSDVFRLVGLSEQQTSSKQADVLNNSWTLWRIWRGFAVDLCCSWCYLSIAACEQRMSVHIRAAALSAL